MIARLSNHSTRLASVPRRSECDEEEIRWEERIRALSKQKVVRLVPPVRPQCSPTRLSLTSRVTRRDHLLIPRALPALSGTESENLVCGRCSEVIGSGLTRRTARREHPDGSRLVIRCTCGALNLVSSEHGKVR